MIRQRPSQQISPLNLRGEMVDTKATVTTTTATTATTTNYEGASSIMNKNKNTNGGVGYLLAWLFSTSSSLILPVLLSIFVALLLFVLVLSSTSTTTSTTLSTSGNALINFPGQKEGNPPETQQQQASSSSPRIGRTANPWDDPQTYEKCCTDNNQFETRSFENERNDFDKQTKTIWVAMFPDSLNESLLKQWIQGLLIQQNLKSPVKAYYLQSKNTLKRCQSTNSITVLCTVVHPLIRMNPPPDSSKFTTYLHPTTIYILRNPMTAFAAHYNAKAIKYHNLPTTQQVPSSDWKKFRDEYLQEIMNHWKTQVRTWAKSHLLLLSSSSSSSSNDVVPYYHVGLYIPFEDMFDPYKGPQILVKLQQILDNAGYLTRNLTTLNNNNKNDNSWQKKKQTLRLLQQEKRSSSLSMSSCHFYDCLWYNSVVHAVQSRQEELQQVQQRNNNRNNNNKTMGGTNAQQQQQQQPKQQQLPWSLSSSSSSLSPVSKYYYDFSTDYLPSFTQAQRDWMIQELKAFVQEFTMTKKMTTMTTMKTTASQQQQQQNKTTSFAVQQEQDKLSFENDELVTILGQYIHELQMYTPIG